MKELRMWWWMQSFSNRCSFYCVASVRVFFTPSMTTSFPPSDRLLLSVPATSFPPLENCNSCLVFLERSSVV